MVCALEISGSTEKVGIGSKFHKFKETAAYVVAMTIVWRWLSVVCIIIPLL